MENPYQSPEESSTPFGPAAMTPELRPAGLVHHVRAIAILMLIQGMLELFAAFGLGAMAIVMPRMIEADMRQMEHPPQMPHNVLTIFTAEFGVMAAAALVTAALHVVAGLRNYQFRGRVMGIVALAGGLATLFTCWCLPTALALGIYGLIVYLNGPVSQAFRMREAGCSTSDIFLTFRR
jgi:hypothetical protein